MSNQPTCEFCGDQDHLILKPRCHLTAPLLAELDGDTLVLKCYIPSCMREVVRFKILRSDELDVLKALRDLHSDVVSLVECIEECEQDGGKSYDTKKTRRLLGYAYAAIAKAEGKEVPHA